LLILAFKSEFERALIEARILFEKYGQGWPLFDFRVQGRIH